MRQHGQFRVLAAISNHMDPGDVSTLANPEVVDKLKELVKQRGARARRALHCDNARRARGLCFLGGGRGVVNRPSRGEVAERSKAHAWKACTRQKRVVGSTTELPVDIQLDAALHLRGGPSHSCERWSDRLKRAGHNPTLRQCVTHLSVLKNPKTRLSQRFGRHTVMLRGLNPLGSRRA